MATAAISVAVCASAMEPYFKSDFDSTSDTPLDGWTCHGSGKTAKDTPLTQSLDLISSYFPEGSEAYKVLSFPGAEDAAYSNSTTVEGGKVEEWLVSPLINVPEHKDAVMLRFEEMAIGSIRPGDYDVYLSEGGTEPEDFTTSLHSGRPKGASNEIVSNTVCVPISGFGGKTIRIAFVNRSSGTCLLGFTGIKILDYYIDVRSRIPEFTSTEGPVETTFDLFVATPAECKGFNARLIVDGETPRESTCDADLSKQFKGEINFKPEFTLSFGQKKGYRLEVTPSDSSLPAFTYEGSTTCAEGFPGVCVMEEATGTWCPACVRGAAALARFSHDYPGQFFGIAVHERDPMTVEAYNTALKKESSISSFPAGWFNRTVRDDPMKTSHVERFVNERLASKVTIDKVFHHIKDGVEKITVFYSPQLCYDTDDACFRAVAVITEDNCKGTNARWNQKNGYSESTPERVGGEDWWPYFEFFSEKGSTIDSSEMEYDHVGWGIYNDYNGSGSDISNSWKAYVPQQYSITFDVPNQEKPNGAGVQNISNTAITVMLLDSRTGHVAGADRMEASEYSEGEPSGTGAIGTDSYTVSRDGEWIRVKGEQPATVEIFNMNGIRVGYKQIKNGETAIYMRDKSPLIIRITHDTHTDVRKLR